MQRAVHQGIVTRLVTGKAPVSNPHFGLRGEGASSRKKSGSATSDSERNAKLIAGIVQRIETRLPGRVRNLSVRIQADVVVLEGSCATYYTKQLAQHAALGIMEENEHLENAIVVTIGR